MGRRIHPYMRDAIMPTWFSIVNSDGDIENKGNLKYVKYICEKGYKV